MGLIIFPFLNHKHEAFISLGLVAILIVSANKYLYKNFSFSNFSLAFLCRVFCVILIVNFLIIILHDRKYYRYKVERISIDERKEKYRLIARNKTLIFTNNRPFLKSKKLKHWKMAWKIDGQINNEYFQQLIIQALEKQI